MPACGVSTRASRPNKGDRRGRQTYALGVHRLALISALFLVPACGDDSSGGSTTAASASDGSSSTSATPATDSTAADGESTASANTSTGPADSGSGGSDSGGSDSSGGTGAAAPTWDNFANEFFETYCWECHGPGDALRDYSVLAMVMAESNSIRCGTAPTRLKLEGCEGEPSAEQFPVGANLPGDDQRTRLVEWIDAGMPES